ncbi:histidine kinase [Nitrincola tibetensis]|uniref:Histidine kinase n=2 Tax=Nitrincola tibetensis TaxID=2219697 RepID=A0A364NLP1_9GAMM|nr:histidine kinase [Nitrincola tibetensis]
MAKKDLDSSVSQKLDNLRNTYKAHLGEYKTELENIWLAINKDPRQLESLISIAHRLSGSGKVYGFTELSLLAKALEEASNTAVTLSKPELTAALAEPLHALLTVLDRDSIIDSNNTLKSVTSVENPSIDKNEAVNLLLIDDDPDFSVQISEILKHRGYSIKYQEDINQLEQAVAEYEPLALIVDMDFSGQRFAGANKVGLWRQKDGAPLPVIFISAFDSFDVRLAAVRAAGNHFLRKPLDVSKLISLLQSELNLAPSEPYRIMIVDDDRDLLSLYGTVLSNAGYSVSMATCAEDAIAMLELEQPELILIDVYMPSCSGIELGRIIRQHEEFATIPLLFMSAAGDTDIQLACARLTSDEFINKPIEPWRLLMVIKSRVLRGRLLRAKTGSLTLSETSVSQDMLTGLPKFAKIRSILDNILQNRDPKALIAVVKIDLRNFHTINNLYGYYFGDQVLQRLAWELTQCLDAKDILCRESADEFILLISNHNSEYSINQFIRSLNIAVDNTNDAEKHTNIALSADIGIACASNETKNADDLLDQADAALFNAKKSPTADVCYYKSWMKDKEKNHFSLARSIIKGLEKEEFISVYQPIFSVSTGKLMGFEALARWQHPDKKVLGPGDFIPLMEEQGLISKLTEQMLSQSLTRLSSWQEKQPDLFMSINLSAQDIQKPTFLSHLRYLIAHHRLIPDRVILEITESLLLSDWQQASNVLNALKEIGVRLALDDFGTGYSSLSYLQRINAAKLKIDRSFIQQSTQTGDSRLLQSIVQLGKTMNMSVIAEGVEQVQELNFLRIIGCDQYQGFLKAKPMLAEEVERDLWI